MLDGLHNGHSKEELKSQSAIDAARDPHSKVTAADAEQILLDESKKAGAAAFQFDAGASSADKARQVKAVSSPAAHSPFSQSLTRRSDYLQSYNTSASTKPPSSLPTKMTISSLPTIFPPLP
jgi:hypothetical protein